MADQRGAGQDAFARMEWAAAVRAYGRADTGTPGDVPLDVHDLERWATAAYLGGHDEAATELWARCHQAHLDEHRPDRAVESAFWAGFGLVQRGEMARGGGWIARADRLVQVHDLDCVGGGYLLVPRALMSLDRGAFGDAHDRFEEAGAIAERFDDPDLRALALLGRGQALFCLGRRDEGTTLFDEVMGAVGAGEVSPVVSGIVYCAVIDECQEAFDVRRAREWTTALGRWCADQPDLVPYRGQCMVHRSQVLQLHGAWGEAMEEATRAHQRLSDPPHPAVGMAHYQLGELLRLRGALGEAEAAYLQAQQSGRPPQPGLALVRLAQGDVDAAAAAIDAAVAGAGDPVALARLLPAFVEIMLATGNLERARSGAAQLAAIAGDAEAPFLTASAAMAEGAVWVADARPRDAMGRLRFAWRLWRDLEAPFEAARTQLLVARACRAMGDHETARMEAESARTVLGQLGAVVARDRTDGEPAPIPSGSSSDLTPRELQVLRRVARGRTNRAIGDELFISARTVERHVSNIMVKLGAANRAAATAIAYQRDLIAQT